MVEDPHLRRLEREKDDNNWENEVHSYGACQANPCFCRENYPLCERNIRDTNFILNVNEYANVICGVDAAKVLLASELDK